MTPSSPSTLSVKPPTAIATVDGLALTPGLLSRPSSKSSRKNQENDPPLKGLSANDRYGVGPMGDAAARCGSATRAATAIVIASVRRLIGLISTDGVEQEQFPTTMRETAHEGIVAADLLLVSARSPEFRQPAFLVQIAEPGVLYARFG